MNQKILAQRLKVLTTKAPLYVGVPYALWTPNITTDVFYTETLPAISYLKRHGINCSAFINILMHRMKKEIPKSGRGIRGGTKFWVHHYKKLNVAMPFNISAQYPIGTLFLRDYRDFTDQGHAAIMINETQIIHSCLDIGVILTDLIKSHSICTYEYAILPEDWII